MATINVPRAKVAELLGLPADTDEETLHQALADAAAAIEAQKNAKAVSAAEARAREEDRRIVIAAYNNSKIVASNIEFYQDAMSRDRKGIRSILAALAPGLPLSENEKIPPDAGVQAVHDRVMGRLGKPRTVASGGRAPVAAAAFRGGTLRGGGTNPPPPPPRAAVDKHGFPVLDMPAPVRISEGKPPETWTKEEQYRHFAHQLGGKFALGVPRPPRGEDGYYWPSPDDHSELVNGEWVEKNPYREVP
jgi:hypothetical protein